MGKLKPNLGKFAQKSTPSSGKKQQPSISAFFTQKLKPEKRTSVTKEETEEKTNGEKKQSNADQINQVNDEEEDDDDVPLRKVRKKRKTIVEEDEEKEDEDIIKKINEKTNLTKGQSEEDNDENNSSLENVSKEMKSKKNESNRKRTAKDQDGESETENKSKRSSRKKANINYGGLDEEEDEDDTYKVEDDQKEEETITTIRKAPIEKSATSRTAPAKKSTTPAKSSASATKKATTPKSSGGGGKNFVSKGGKGNFVWRKNSATKVDLSNNGKLSHSSVSSSSTTQVASTEPGQSVDFKTVDLKTLTPLEKQFVEVKRKYPDALLFVECGYKYRFFGEDAEIAARELKIYCHLDHSFMTASIPVQRLSIHVGRLVELNYKVGIVQQTESAALKAKGSEKNKLFTRDLTAMYTKGTLVGEDMSPLQKSGDNINDKEASFLMCICEGPTSEKDNKIVFGVVAVHLHTGEIMYDFFEDGTTRNELQTRIAHLGPCEFLLSENMTKRTKTFLDTISRQRDIRKEYTKASIFDYNAAFAEISDFFGQEENSQIFEKIINLNPQIISCFGALITHLKLFKLDGIFRLASTNLKEFKGTGRLTLNGVTVQNLELFSNQTDCKENGSLLWILDHTKTSFGKRLLKRWIGQPLAILKQIEERLESVKWLRQSEDNFLSSIQNLFSNLPDIERGLARIYYKKCSTSEFEGVLQAFKLIAKVFDEVSRSAALPEDSLLPWIFKDNLSEMAGRIDTFFAKINKEAARKGNKSDLFENDCYPEIASIRKNIRIVVKKINEHKLEIKKRLVVQTFEYKTVNGQEYVIEVKNAKVSSLPQNWVKIGGTKAVSRFQTPVLMELLEDLAAHREELNIAANDTWTQYLSEFGSYYDDFHQLIQKVGTLDCLMSLVQVSLQPDYILPTFVDKKDGDGPCFNAIKARHPMVSVLKDDRYVPNDVSHESSCSMIITGPNMGGKSCYMRMVALLVIMAQIGSYVPAESLELGVFDAVYTRMGASDDIHRGMSTFMVELEETSQILHSATSSSLVLLDELGRGTSTHDGVAIAYATAYSLISKTKCMMLFATHYPPLSQLENVFPDQVSNHHMSYMEDSSNRLENGGEGGDDGEVDTITFLYQMVRGMASQSYGLNVAKLAAVPDSILKEAGKKSRELKALVASRCNSAESQANSFKRLMDSTRTAEDSADSEPDDKSLAQLVQAMAQLQYTTDHAN